MLLLNVYKTSIKSVIPQLTELLISCVPFHFDFDLLFWILYDLEMPYIVNPNFAEIFLI